jgi:hypothetical protein
LSTNQVLENLRKQWYHYHNNSNNRTNQQKQQQLQIKEEVKTKPQPQPKIKHRTESECFKCKQPIVFDSLFLNDFTGKYIPLDPDLHQHKCPRGTKDNTTLDKTEQ